MTDLVAPLLVGSGSVPSAATIWLSSRSVPVPSTVPIRSSVTPGPPLGVSRWIVQLSELTSYAPSVGVPEVRLRPASGLSRTTTLVASEGP